MYRSLPMILASAMYASSASAALVAVTEFENDVTGDEATLEWIEVFNYTNGTVDMTGYTVGDEDSDAFVLGTVVIPSGGYAILADDPAAFIAEWGVGTIGVDVFDVDITLSNTSDEIIVWDDGLNMIWSLAYADDDDAGFATWYTENTDWSVVQFGDKLYPGVVRAGDDNGEVGFLGYESGAATVDPFAWTTPGGNTGSPLSGGHVAQGGGVPTLDINGVCPGQTTISVSNMTPYGQYGIVTASGPGGAVVPSGSCQGADLGVDPNFTFRGLWTADGLGSNSISPTLPQAACGLTIVAFDVGSCTRTNVTTLP